MLVFVVVNSLSKNVNFMIVRRVARTAHRKNFAIRGVKLKMLKTRVLIQKIQSHVRDMQNNVVTVSLVRQNN